MKLLGYAKRYGPGVLVAALGVVLVSIFAPLLNPGVEKAQGWVGGLKGGSSGSGSGSGSGGAGAE